MAKIENDKYYTPITLANKCWHWTLSRISPDTISEIIEPSCGNGSFYHFKDFVPHFGYDIDPQFSYTGVIKADYLSADIRYLPGRLIIGNPPYGRCLNLAQKFYKKSVEIADYIAFILPISQLHNNHFLYEFDLVDSFDLESCMFSHKKLHCCFNIYQRPQSGILNKKPQENLKDVSIYRQDCKDYQSKPYDIRMCYWGDGTAGKILKDGETYSGEYKIKINNKILKDSIIKYLQDFDWGEYLQCIAMRRIKQYHIIKILQKQFPTIT